MTNHAFKKKQQQKKFHFSTTGAEKSTKFEDFWKNICIYTKAIVKNCTFQKISQKKNAPTKQVYIYAANLNKNHSFQKINLKKFVNFASFQQIKHIFTQPIAKKGVNFANFLAV